MKRKLWATRDSGILGDNVTLWLEKPHNKPYPGAGQFFWCMNHGKQEIDYWAFSRNVFKAVFGRLPRRDRPMRVELTGKVLR